jgi:hypothetical protein
MAAHAAANCSMIRSVVNAADDTASRSRYRDTKAFHISKCALYTRVSMQQLRGAINGETSPKLSY